jgi:hypothetical protein
MLINQRATLALYEKERITYGWNFHLALNAFLGIAPIEVIDEKFLTNLFGGRRDVLAED